MSAWRPIKIGLLGAGATAQVVHLPILSQLSGVQVVGLADRDKDRAQAIASRFGVPRVFERDEDVFDASLDAVIVCTPSYLHEPHTIAALEAGKDVLVEKPLALTAEGADRVLSAAERAGRSVLVAMNGRYRPDVQALRPFIQAGDLGDVFSLSAAWLNRRVRFPRTTWRHRRQTAGGGALMDLGVQIMDLCLWLLDYPRVERLVARLHPGAGMEVEDAGSVMMSVAGGLTVVFEVSWKLPAPRDRLYLNVVGTRGSASLPPLAVHREAGRQIVDATPKVATGPDNPYILSYRRELLRFVEVCRGEQRVELPREQVELMRLMALAYRSAEEGRELPA